MNNTGYWTADRIMRLLIGIFIAVVVVLLLKRLEGALLPFFIACLIAYLLQPLVQLNRRLLHEKGRVFSSILTILEVSAVFAGCLYLMIPSIIRECDYLSDILTQIEQGRRHVSPELQSLIDFVNHNFNIDTMREYVSKMRMESLISSGSSILSESIEVLERLLDVVLVFVYVLFILIDYPQITRGFKLIIPYRYREGALSIVRDMQTSMNHYFRGQGKVAFCAAILYCSGFTLIGLPLAIPLGLLVGVLYMIPYFQYVTIIPVGLVCFIYSIGGAESFLSIFGKSILVYVVSQSLCDYVITPRIMGKELGLNAAVILLSLSIWGSLLGILGMIIALPVTSLVLSYYQIYISNPRKQVKKHDDDDNALTTQNESNE